MSYPWPSVYLLLSAICLGPRPADLLPQVCWFVGEAAGACAWWDGVPVDCGALAGGGW